MVFSNAVICILFTALIASYAWGMRGAVIGGEKGAMLPGAFIGLILAWFADGGIRENFWIIAATGLMGMTYGGTEPYGETIGMVLHKGRADYRPVKGYSGLALKGALWFSVCGGFIAVSFSSMSGSIYSAKDIVIFCLLIPVLQRIGYCIFNTPYDKEKGIYPKSYYSLTRREEWGSNLVLLIAMTAMGIIKNDGFTLALIAGGFIGGATGWLVAMKAYAASVFPMKNGKYFFGKLYHKGLFDGWKLMEFILGAFGGFGISFAYCLNYEYVTEYNRLIALNGRWQPIQPAEKAMPYIMAVIIICIFAVNFYQFVCERKGEKVNSFACDLIERPLYNVIPMLLVLLGSVFAARIMTVFMLVFVCLIKFVFERTEKTKINVLTQIVAFIICVVVFVGDIIFEGYGPFGIIIAGTVPYLVAEFLISASRQDRKGKTIKEMLTKTSFATVFSCFVFQAIIIVFVTAEIFEI